MNPFATYAMIRAIVAGTVAPLAPSWSEPHARLVLLPRLTETNLECAHNCKQNSRMQKKTSKLHKHNEGAY